MRGPILSLTGRLPPRRPFAGCGRQAVRPAGPRNRKCPRVRRRRCITLATLVALAGSAGCKRPEPAAAAARTPLAARAPVLHVVPAETAFLASSLEASERRMSRFAIYSAMVDSRGARDDELWAVDGPRERSDVSDPADSARHDRFISESRSCTDAVTRDDASGRHILQILQGQRDSFAVMQMFPQWSGLRFERGAVSD